MEAVLSRKILPPEVTGLVEAVPTLCPSAVYSAPLPDEVKGLFVPGLIYPLLGLPELLIGRTICEMPP